MNTSTLDFDSLRPAASREHANAKRNPANASANVNEHAASPAARDAAKVARAESLQRAEKTAQADGQEGAQAQRAQLTEVLERVSRMDHRLSFKVDESSGKSVVIVSDARTSEVLKQFPSEEMLNVARRLEEHLQQSGAGAGLLHTDEA